MKYVHVCVRILYGVVSTVVFSITIHVQCQCQWGQQQGGSHYAYYAATRHTHGYAQCSWFAMTMQLLCIVVGPLRPHKPGSCMI